MNLQIYDQKVRTLINFFVKTNIAFDVAFWMKGHPFLRSTTCNGDFVRSFVHYRNEIKL